MGTVLSFLRLCKANYLPPAGRTGELFLRNLRQVQSRTDTLFFYVLLMQYPAAIAVAALWSPLAWSGSRSTIHFHVWLAIIFGGLLTSLPVFLIRTRPAAPLTRQVVTVAQMLMGALLIHLSGGRIETHFHVFGSLAFLAFYRDVGVLATATVIVAVDHLVRGLVIPESVYGTNVTSNWRFVEHAGWVLFENVFLTLSCVQGREQLAAMSSQQAELEEVNAHIEAAVRVRTHELSLKTEELAAARDAAMESTRLKSQFLANVSHEIRTPMNGVLGMTNLLLETDLTQEQQECALTVQRSAEGLLAVINDILDFSKIENGKLTIEHLEFPLRTVIEDVVALLAGAAERKGLKLVCEIDSGVSPIVTGDAGRLRQILVNLIGNAIKFTELGEVTVRVNQADRQGGADRVRFEVSDTGIGIGEDERKNLFQAFVQVDGSTTRKHEGTGLGLAISKHLVNLMQGEIGLDSTPGIGSTFWFEIPFAESTHSAQARIIQWNALSGVRILILDDSSAGRGSLLKILKEAGVSAAHAASGQEMLGLLKRGVEQGEPLDLALLDLELPHRDAIQFVSSIRAHEDLQLTKILVVTSLGQRSLRASIRRSGAADCIVKPVRREQLFETLARLCGRSAPGSRETQQAARPRPVPPLAGQLSVLVAEDNPVNQRVVTRMLEHLGHRYHVVTDGAAAVEAYKGSPYDIVLMDCQMPRMDGFAATAEIRRLPDASQVPIIAVTANAMSGDRERCMAAGMTGYIAKPVRLGELARVLADAGGRQQPDAGTILCAQETGG